MADRNPTTIAPNVIAFFLGRSRGISGRCRVFFCFSETSSSAATLSSFTLPLGVRGVRGDDVACVRCGALRDVCMMSSESAARTDVGAVLWDPMAPTVPTVNSSLAVGCIVELDSLDIGDGVAASPAKKKKNMQVIVSTMSYYFIRSAAILATV